MSDLIDRQAAIDSIRECVDCADANCEWDLKQGYLNAIECIEEEPSAEPERKKGKWIKTDEKEEWYGDIYKCSVCGYRLIDANEKYCPNCGAYMREEK